jgi:hypothetical protein
MEASLSGASEIELVGDGGGSCIQAGTRRSSRITVAGLQAPRPLGVGTPRAVNALAIPLSVATPAAPTSAITGSRTVARAAAFADFAAAAMRAWPRLPASSRGFAQLHAASLGSGQSGFRAR